MFQLKVCAVEFSIESLTNFLNGFDMMIGWCGIPVELLCVTHEMSCTLCLKWNEITL